MIASDLLKGLWVQKFRSAISWACEEHSKVMRHDHWVDLTFVDLGVLDGGSWGNIDDHDLSCLSCYVKCLVKGSPGCASELCRSRCCNFLYNFRSVFWPGRNQVCQVVDSDIGYLIVDVNEQELLVPIRKRNLNLPIARDSHGGGSWAILDVEDIDSVDWSGQQILWVLCDINWGACALHVKLAGSHALEGIVHSDLAVVTAGEEQVTILIVYHLAHWSRVTWNVVRLHRRVSSWSHFLNSLFY